MQHLIDHLLYASFLTGQYKHEQSKNSYEQERSDNLSFPLTHPMLKCRKG